MRPDLITRWKGIALTLVGIVATVWLAATGRLGLYIHPRYFVFTAVMAVVGGAVALAALALATNSASGSADAHAGDEVASDAIAASAAGSARRRRLRSALTITIVLGAAVALLVFPPATLTAQTAVQRDIDRTSADLAGDAPDLAGADPSTFTVKDWALLLRQTDDPASFGSQPVELVGFVSPMPGDPDDGFYISRFTVTCCAVDAQPIGVPVHLPGWKDRFAVDDWVEASGVFVTDPWGAGELVLRPELIEPTEQPGEPYVY